MNSEKFEFLFFVRILSVPNHLQCPLKTPKRPDALTVKDENVVIVTFKKVELDSGSQTREHRNIPIYDVNA